MRRGLLATTFVALTWLIVALLMLGGVGEWCRVCVCVCVCVCGRGGCWAGLGRGLGVS